MYFTKKRAIYLFNIRHEKNKKYSSFKPNNLQYLTSIVLYSIDFSMSKSKERCKEQYKHQSTWPTVSKATCMILME